MRLFMYFNSKRKFLAVSFIETSKKKNNAFYSNTPSGFYKIVNETEIETRITLISNNRYIILTGINKNTIMYIIKNRKIFFKETVSSCNSEYNNSSSYLRSSHITKNNSILMSILNLPNGVLIQNNITVLKLDNILMQHTFSKIDNYEFLLTE